MKGKWTQREGLEDLRKFDQVLKISAREWFKEKKGWIKENQRARDYQGEERRDWRERIKAQQTSCQEWLDWKEEEGHV